MFFIELFLTDFCNRNCWYCHIKNINRYQYIELDIDYLNEVIHYFGDTPLFVHLSGGEPGLISNLYDIIINISKRENIKKYQIMTNGLLRYNKSPVLDYLIRDKKCVGYNEHLIIDIDDTGNYIKQYNMDFANFIKYKNIIVLTPKFLEKISYKEIQQLKTFSTFKPMISSEYPIEKYLLFYKKLSNISDGYLSHIIKSNNKINLSSRIYCGRYPHNPGINLIKKTIVHCILQHKHSIEYLITKDNINKLLKGQLFTPQDYCMSCKFADIDKDKPKHILKAQLSSIYNNRTSNWHW